MTYRSTLRGETFTFSDLRELLGRAGAPKAGDALAGVGARSERERVAAQWALADVAVAEIVGTPLVEDDVTALVLDRLDRDQQATIAGLTVGELRERILGPGFADEWAAGLHRGITPEVGAAVAKLMGTRDLIQGAAPLRVVTRCRNTMGGPGVFGVRVQPNHPSDDLGGVLLSAADGLLFGCGDAVIGVNPAGDSVEVVAGLERALAALLERTGAPTQTCVLAHVTTQLAALDRGAPVDLLFQSIGGTTATNDSYGVSLSVLAEGRDAVVAHHRERGGFLGEQVMYFETGQGSSLSAGADHGVDQLTCEARAYGVARAFDPFLVNSVVGFIGPEYLADGRQIIRAGLEDHFVGKLLGLPMGCDVCYTNHVEADQDTTDQLLVLLATAGCNYVMGVPGSDDVMLNYQSTSYHDAAGVRELLDLRPAPEFEAWLESVGVMRAGRLTEATADGPGSMALLAAAVREIGA
ncbi:ethanolamine ammonia-lyase subunit EutB [Rhabdothermincola salaria]|uniref:ethanolamine ammonia-lyase subunit EutB n=1 Tax=Rhabdothermincola salaria TaxID=2903142 RepID=UPI001E53F0D3|nr:ethanolamine ammonia-lyase subunit EutB [Rhabdothermincola salaria]MCD9623454.1 ethanolamine ammonia-lyase subunit EutB [Rhabdothermincola salaria]